MSGIQSTDWGAVLKGFVTDPSGTWDRVLNPDKYQKNADAYAKATEARRAIRSGSVQDSPRNDNSVYKGVLNQNPSPTPPQGQVEGASTQQHTPYFLSKVVPPNSTPTPQVPTATPTPDLKNWENFKPYIAKQAAERGYSRAPVVSQIAVESARGKSPFAQQRNNYGGIGAVDSNPNKAFSFKSPEDFLNYYFNMIQKRFPEAFKVRSDPKAYINALKQSGYATDPNYVNTVTNTPEYRDYSY